jgi:FkbM family methyltransferase
MPDRILQLENKIHEFFNFKPNGFFVDIGAYDGVSISNTKFLEDLGWDGICVEPHPNVFKKLVENRKCKKVNCAIWNENTEVNFLSLSGYTEMLSGIYESYDSRHYQRVLSELQLYGGNSELIKIKANTFDTIVDNTNIDFLSIDTEGSELQILEQINFEKFDIKLICVENNFYENKFDDFFHKKGYKLYSTINIDYLYAKI